MEEVHGVDGLLHRHHQVDHAEVVLEAVADEDAAAVHQVPGVVRMWRGEEGGAR